MTFHLYPPGRPDSVNVVVHDQLLNVYVVPCVTDTEGVLHVGLDADAPAVNVPADPMFDCDTIIVLLDEE